MAEHIENDSLELLKKGEAFFMEGKIEKAERAFLDFIHRHPDNSEAYNNLGVVSLENMQFDSAEKYLMSSLEIDPANKDAIFNYSTLLKHQSRILEISPILDRALTILPGDPELQRLENEILTLRPNRPKMAVLCLPGLESFLGDIITFLKCKYDVRTCFSNNYSEIEAVIKWADIVWLEWANDLAIHVTNRLPNVSEKQVICRIHSYEVLGGYLPHIDWAKISKAIFVSDHILKIAKEIFPPISDLAKTSVIHNGVNLKKFPYKKRSPGFNIGVVGHISHKKNPCMWIEVLSRLVDKDKRYTLKVAGSVQDLRYKYYFESIIPKLGLTDNIKIFGQVDEINRWFETNDVNYLLTTSPFESFGYVIAEAMAMGYRPLIHAFPGADQIWPKDCIFGCIDDLIKLLKDKENYDSWKYRKFIEERYTLESQLDRLEGLLNETEAKISSKAAFSNRQYGNETHKSLKIHPDLAEYHRPDRTLIVTGIPRSGTSLFSALLNEFDNSICLNEILYDVDTLPSSFAEIRRRLISGETIPNRYDNSGNLTTDTQGSGANVEERIAQNVDENAVIGSKVNIPYLNQIQKILEYGYKIIAIVRDPVYVIASWNSVKSSIIPEAHVTENDMNPRWRGFKFDSHDKIERQAQIWNFYANIIWSLRNKIKIYTYELLTSDPAWVIKDLCDFLGLAPPANMPKMSNQNIDSRYAQLEEIKEAVKRYCPVKDVFAYSYLDYEDQEGTDERQAHKKQNPRGEPRSVQTEWNRSINYSKRPILAEKGTNSSHLVIAFGGIANQLYLPPFEFFRATNSLSYSRILVRDFNQGWYHLGVDQDITTFEAVINELKIRIDELDPETICTVGTSAGGYAALAFGHFLKVDYVHALAPQTLIDRDNRKRIGETRWTNEINRIYENQPSSSWFYDLGKLLIHHNGKTVYNIHVCKGCPLDIAYAKYVEDLPGLNIIEYDCSVHNIAKHLKDNHLLNDILEKPKGLSPKFRSFTVGRTDGTENLLKEEKVDPPKNNLQIARTNGSRASGNGILIPFQDIQTYVLFIGYPRSGHSLIGSLLDAHSNITIAHELDALALVEKGCSRDKLFQLIINNSKEFTEVGRKWTGYSYSVPNQWHGRYTDLKVIGDKKGGKSIWRLRSDPSLLKRLQDLVGVEVKLIHVIRNPFDNISTIFNKEPEKGLEHAIGFYFTMVDTLAKLRNKANGRELHEVSIESFIANPRKRLATLCSFLNVDASHEYLEDCASIVFPSPRKTRHSITWPSEMIKKVEDKIEEYCFLSKFSYKS